MALQVQPVDSRLRIRLEIGQDDQGNPKYSTRTYSGIKAGAADQDVYDIAVALISLQEFPAASIDRINQVEMVDV
ncbi:MAG: hypothetical protein HPY66_1503 [Firmicutes bacterium]|nr:hypothetical protein [Bacillota bacterium]MDI6707254.1 DUF1659 domain-containing protein [Bacillota bacterium]